MITGLASAGVWSEDIQKKLLPFYRDVLGLPVAIDSPEFVVLGTNPQEPSVTLGTHSDVKGNNPDPARHMVGLLSTDVRGDVAALKSKGVEFIDEGEDFENITVATLKDPEGNLVQLVQFR